MAKCSIIVSFDTDDYLSLLEREPDLSGLLHELGQMIIRRDIEVPPFTRTISPPRRGKKETSVREVLLERLYDTAYEIARRGDGEWVRWQDLRPNLRYRDAYGERIWQLFVEDPDMETRAIQHGARVRRAVRFAPLV